MHRAIVATGIAITVVVASYTAYHQFKKPQYALVDDMKNITDVGIQYRTRMTKMARIIWPCLVLADNIN
jgi:hypothetical protein